LFSTELTRITMQLRARRISEAVSAGVEGRPRLVGRHANRRRDPPVSSTMDPPRVARTPVVLLISDGWDRGDPEVLRAQIARLQRSCHRLIWLNPLIGNRGL
jgi:uncharacterized protein with von Willebrand factor type A (vWA) domain